MLAMDRLKQKVEEWKRRIAELEEANATLKLQVEQSSGSSSSETGDLRAQLETCQQTVVSLKEEMKEKDQEIEATIANVTALFN